MPGIARPSVRPLGRLWRHLRGSAASLLDAIYPPRCPGCRVRLSGGPTGRDVSWCEPCEGTLFELLHPRCSICATPRPTQIGRVYRGVDAVCPRCAERRPAFDFTDSLFEYTGAVADAIQYAKYAPATWPIRALEARFGPWLIDRLDEFDTPPVVTTVPMHRKDLSRRGFHLVEMLLHRAARRDGRLRSSRVLEKTRFTPPQAGLTLGERLGNVRGAFACIAPEVVEGRRVVLVDDVMTTGATADAASRAMRESGASAVVVMTFARAVK